MLAKAVDIKRWLHEDRHTLYVERLNRDRAIGLSLPTGTDEERLLAWWSRVPRGEMLGTGARVNSLRRIATGVLFVIGLVLGFGIGSVALYSDGAVNLFALLGVLVGIPLLLLVVTVVLSFGQIPGVDTVRNAFSGINPGRWAAALVDRIAGLTLFALFPGDRSAKFCEQWQLVVFSQWLAVGFFVGVLGITWLLLAFTDIAFGWSTTFRIEPGEVSGWVAALAAPWSSWLPVAAPNAALVEASRIFRMEEGGMPASRVVHLGQWWPFVVMSIITYGLLPRTALLAVGVLRLRVATASLLRDDPEVTALLDRLNTPLVTYEGEGESADIASPDALPTPVSMPLDQVTNVVVWNDATTDARVSDWLRERFGIASEPPVAVSVLQGESEHRRLLGEMRADIRRLVVFTKGWEPPLLEFSDFLDMARDRFDPGISIALVPVDVTGTAVKEDEREIWARALARQHDPRLYVMGAGTVLAARP